MDYLSLQYHILYFASIFDLILFILTYRKIRQKALYKLLFKTEKPVQHSVIPA